MSLILSKKQNKMVIYVDNFQLFSLGKGKVLETAFVSL